MNAARPVVRAIVVSDGRSDHLTDVLASLAEHEYDTLDVVVVDGDAPELPPELRGDVVSAPGATYREAVDAALARHPDLERDYLWLLHDDTAPLPGALTLLAATARKRRRAAIVGAAQVRWDEPSRLVGLASTTSRVGARRVSLVEEDDVNQGQHDSRDDVLAVSLAGALVRRDWWKESGGIDDAYRGFGESLDLCRRAWRSGYDVVVVPAARIRHAQDALNGVRAGSSRGRASSYAARRTGEWYHALAYAPAAMLPLLVLWSFLAVPARIVLRIAQNDGRTAVSDLGVPWRLLGRLGSLRRSRSAVRRATTAPISIERQLLATPREVLHHVRVAELGAYDAWRESQAPTDVERAELAVAAARRRRGLAVTAFLALVVSLALHADWFIGLARGEMLSGAVLGVTDLSFAEVWSRVLTGWDETGFGGATLDSAYASLMLPLAAIPGGLRIGAALLLSLAPLIAALGGWAAAGVVVRSTWARGAAALAYAVWPLFLVSVADGRMGAVIAHLALPWVVFGLVRGAGWHRGEPVGDGEYPRVPQASPSASAGAAFAGAVTVAAAPVLLAPLLIVVAVAGVLARGTRLRTWGIAVPALVVSGPAILAAVERGSGDAVARILARDVGPVGGVTTLSPWTLLLGGTVDGPTSAQLGSAAGGDLGATGVWLAFAVGACVLLAAVAALVSLRAGWAVRASVAVATLGLAAAIVSQHTPVGAVDGAGGQVTPGWAGAGSSLMALGLITAAAAASSGSWRTGQRSRGLAWRRTGYAVSLGAVAAVLAGHVAVASLLEPAADSATPSGTRVLPLATALDQQSSSRQRALVIDEDEDDGTISYSVLGTDGTVRVLGTAERDAGGVTLSRAAGDAPASPADLAEAVGTLAGGAEGAATALTDWGIGIVVVAPGADALVSALTQVDDVAAIGASDYGTPFRVVRGDGTQASRAWLEEGDATVTVPMDATSGTLAVDAKDATVVLAEAADDAWHATLDGAELSRVDDEEGRNAWALDGAGTLEIRYDDPAHTAWLWAAALVCGWVLLASVPLHRSRGRESA
ncbi:glycosyltransferase [Demequina salsinemoris]|uniref:glycosyltransferase n=1 Tax=Demequina salsinemoris TaxID=577470 RepID=UPI000785D256|nr:glycosyltransferase [Demequina salsinemoris]